MSITPGWKPKKFKAYTPGIPVTFSITVDRMVTHDHTASSVGTLYLDNGQEYKDFPDTKEGWAALCDTLKGFEP